MVCTKKPGPLFSAVTSKEDMGLHLSHRGQTIRGFAPFMITAVRQAFYFTLIHRGHAVFAVNHHLVASGEVKRGQANKAKQKHSVDED